MIDPPQSAGTSNDHFQIIVWGLVVILGVLIPLLFQMFRTKGAVTQAQKDVAEVKYQVKNNHSSNLREEADDRHHENSLKLDDNSKKLDRTITLVMNVFGQLEEITNDIKELKTSDARHTEQISDIEHTQDRAKIKRH